MAAMLKYSVLSVLLGLSNVRAALPEVATRASAIAAEKAAIIRSTLAILDVPPTPLCNGTFDFLMSITTFPVAGEDTSIPPETIEITLSDGSVVYPTCITLAPASEDDERRAVLTIGDFTPEEGVGPVKVTAVGDLYLALPSGGQVNLKGESFEKPPKDGKFLGQGKEFGPEFIDFSLDDPRDPATDENDCKAVFPDTTHAVQIVYQAGVREKNLTDTDGSTPLSPVGGTADAARANKMYSVGTSFENGEISGGEDIEILGIADSDADNFVDLCLKVTFDGFSDDDVSGSDDSDDDDGDDSGDSDDDDDGKPRKFGGNFKNKFKSRFPDFFNNRALLAKPAFDPVPTGDVLYVKMMCPEGGDEAGIVFTVTGKACAKQVLALPAKKLKGTGPRGYTVEYYD